MKKLTLLALICAVASLQACDYSGFSSSPDKDYNFKLFGERCDMHIECLSTFCMNDEQGNFCTKLCEEGCPEDWTCQEVQSPHGDGSVGLCAKPRHMLCTACTTDDLCGGNGSNLCMELDDGKFCLMDCSYQACPTGYSCEAVTASAGFAEDIAYFIAEYVLPVLEHCENRKREPLSVSVFQTKDL